MKITMTLAAAALFAGTAAIAQDTGSAMTPSTGAPATTAPADAGMAAPADAMAPSATTGAMAGGMTQENGKWMKDGRPATKAEIAEHKKMMKKPG